MSSLQYLEVVFCFLSLRDRAKAWFSSLPKNSIDSWNKCKDAFISKYFPPAKIISLRNDIMNFKQLDHEHVAQAWERMKLMIRNCPTHGLNLWMIIQKIYVGLNFASRNILDSAAGGTFMEITLGDATKLLDNIMVNYSQWHTERSSNKKVHAIKEINVLSGKMDELMKLFATKSVSSDPNDMPLSTLIENNNESMDVNFVGSNNFGNSAYRRNLILGRVLVIPLIIMIIPTITLMEIIIRCPLILRLVLKNL